MALTTPPPDMNMVSGRALAPPPLHMVGEAPRRRPHFSATSVMPVLSRVNSAPVRLP